MSSARCVKARGTSNSCYETVLSRVVQILHQHNRHNLELILNAEGTKDVKHVVDIDGGLTDFAAILGVERSIGPNDSIQLLEDVCRSHIFITAKSGFSHFIALLCDDTFVMAVPFWHSYKNLPNAIVLNEIPDYTVLYLPGKNISIPGENISIPCFTVSEEQTIAGLRSFKLI